MNAPDETARVYRYETAWGDPAWVSVPGPGHPGRIPPKRLAFYAHHEQGFVVYEYRGEVDNDARG